MNGLRILLLREEIVDWRILVQTRLVGKLPSVERIRNPITTLGGQVGWGSSSSLREDVISKNKRTHVGEP